MYLKVPCTMYISIYVHVLKKIEVGSGKYLISPIQKLCAGD